MAMKLSIDFTGDVENLLLQRAAQAGKDVATFVRNLVTDRLENSAAVAPRQKLSHDEFMAKIRSIIAMHPMSHGKMDDSRESIYAGCGVI